MKLAGLIPAHNEAWVLRASLRAALLWCDFAVVLLHACIDETREVVETIAAENPGRVVVLEETDPTWHEMTHRQWILEEARSLGATHMAIVDADEILTGNLLETIREHCERLAPGQLLRLPGYNLRGGLIRYHANGIWANRWFSVVFRDQPGFYWGGDKFHSREPMGLPLSARNPVRQGEGGVMHLWGASERRLIAKHRAYKLTERIRWPQKSVREIDQMYSLAIKGQPGDRPEGWRYTTVPASWWEPYGALPSLIDLDSTPHQEAECEAMLAEYGRERFAGLDLFEAAKEVCA